MRRLYYRSLFLPMPTGMKFPVFRPKWRSGQFSDVQIEEVSDIQVDATCGIHASFPVFRPKWHTGQFPGVQTDV